jgi:hypothetical protein
MFKQFRSLKQFFKFLTVKDHRESGIISKRRKNYGPFGKTDMSEVEPKTIDHMFKTASGGSLRFQGKTG